MDANKIDDFEVGMSGLSDTLQKTGLNMAALSKMASGLMGALGNAVITFAITKGIEFAAKKIYEMVHATEIAQQKFKDTSKAISDLNTQYSDQAKLVSDSGDRVSELQEKYSKGTLQSDEYQEFFDLSNQFAEMFPELITGFTDEGEAILNLGSNAEEARGKLEELLKANRHIANDKIIEKLPDLYQGFETYV